MQPNEPISLHSRLNVIINTDNFELWAHEGINSGQALRSGSDTILLNVQNLSVTRKFGCVAFMLAQCSVEWTAASKIGPWY